MTGELKLEWLGCAGFRLEVDGVGLLIDPWLSRPAWAQPPVIAREDELWPAEGVLVSHGHFDHAADLPELSRGRALPIYTHGGTAKLLARRGVEGRNLRGVESAWSGAVGPFTLKCRPTRHIFYGWSLMARTLRRIGWRAPWLAPLGLCWPCGQALAWRVKVGGVSLVHMGTAGATARELDAIAADGPVDVLLVALQGHDRIHEIAAAIVDHLRPQVVVPHHHDDFYPPISQMIAIHPLEERILRFATGIRVHEPRPGDPLRLNLESLNNRSYRA